MDSISKRLRVGLISGVLCLSSIAGTAVACDLCAIFNDLGTERPIAGAVRASVAEQFSYFGKVQDNGHVYDDPANQHLASSITQLVGGYDVSARFSLQANLPYISRHYRRAESGAVDSGVEAGIGDMSLLGNVVVLDKRGKKWSVLGRFFGGVELPTGDADRLAEESDESHHHRGVSPRHGGEDHGDEGDEVEGDDHGANELDGEIVVDDEGHHGDDDVASAIHGHDLALGSGSYDFPVGFSLVGNYETFFVHAELQYLIRTEGDHDYRYANDLLWSFSPGVYVLSGEKTTLSLAVDLSGEYKREDSVSGDDLDDTAIRSIFIGPELRVSHGAWRGSFVWEKPIDINNSGVQTVITDRIRASVSYWF